MRSALTDKENKDAWAWFSTHTCKKRASSPELILRLRPTGIAYSVEASCTACSKIKDVSDYGSW